MIELYIVNIDLPVCDAQYRYWMSCVSNEQRRRIEGFRFVDDKKRTLYGDILCRLIIGKKIGLAAEKVIIEKNSYGKPYVKGDRSIHFNISHSGKWVVCAVAKHEIGVDIEEIREIDLEIARRFFTPCEYKSIISNPESERLKSFYRIWTLKESYIKQIGKGLSVPLNSFEIVKAGKIYRISEGDKELAMRSSNEQGRYMLSICHLADEPFGGVNETDLGEMCFSGS